MYMSTDLRILKIQSKWNFSYGYQEVSISIRLCGVCPSLRGQGCFLWCRTLPNTLVVSERLPVTAGSRPPEEWNYGKLCFYTCVRVSLVCIYIGLVVSDCLPVLRRASVAISNNAAGHSLNSNFYNQSLILREIWRVTPMMRYAGCRDNTLYEVASVNMSPRTPF